MKIRRGLPADLPKLIDLEENSFEPSRCDSRATIKRSLRSPHQEVWVCVEDGRIVGSLFLRIHKHTCRIYSIAVDAQARGKGIGRQLLEHAKARGQARGCGRISLEADSRNEQLLTWYLKHGYKKVKTIHDYYSTGWGAVRFTMDL